MLTRLPLFFPFSDWYCPKSSGVTKIGDCSRGIAQSGSASALGAESRGFKSLCPELCRLRDRRMGRTREGFGSR